MLTTQGPKGFISTDSGKRTESSGVQVVRTDQRDRAGRHGIGPIGGLPPQVRAEERAIHSTAGDNRGSRDEFAAIPAALQQARALESLGDKPLAVVTAGSEAQAGWLPLQDEMAALSTRGVHLVLPDATHASLIEDERDAAVSGQAIVNVVDAVRGTSVR